LIIKINNLVWMLSYSNLKLAYSRLVLPLFMNLDLLSFWKRR